LEGGKETHEGGAVIELFYARERVSFLESERKREKKGHTFASAMENPNAILSGSFVVFPLFSSPPAVAATLPFLTCRFFGVEYMRVRYLRRPLHVSSTLRGKREGRK
jgi:hypothetical protein